MVEDVDKLFSNHVTHRIGSHSDPYLNDWGGSSDKICLCDLKSSVDALIAEREQAVRIEERDHYLNNFIHLANGFVTFEDIKQEAYDRLAEINQQQDRGTK